MNNLLEIKNLNKTYHTKDSMIEAIKNLNLTLKENEFIAIVGPSGCGKSTILNILCGLDKEYKGLVNINNKTIGYMPQVDSLFSFRNILDNSLIGLEIKKNKTKENIKYVKELLYTYGLKDFVYRYPKELSGGMRQRVSLIRTLAIKPDILLLDEPFSALDYQSRLSVSNDVYKIIKNENKSVIMVTHDIAEAISMADKVIVLNSRPCSIKKIYDIKLEVKSNPIDNRQDKNFNYYFDKIWRDLDVHL